MADDTNDTGTKAGHWGYLKDLYINKNVIIELTHSELKKISSAFNLKNGEHFEYFKTFFNDIFYNQKEDKIKNSVNEYN